jgi:hypothetical protein
MNEDIGAARIGHCQKLLFPKTAREICAEIGLNWWAAEKLFNEQWLSFNPETGTALDEGQEAELRFVGSLVVGGCHGDLLRQLFTELEKPYRYRAGQIYYDWSTQRWRPLPQPQNQRDTFYDWLEELKQNGDTEQLQELRDTIEASLKQIAARK